MVHGYLAIYEQLLAGEVQHLAEAQAIVSAAASRDRTGALGPLSMTTAAASRIETG